MSAGNLGRRYERILLLAAPIAFATLVVLFIAIASDTQNDRVQARCFTQAADILLDKKELLDKEWQKAVPVKKSGYWAGTYKLAIQTAFIYGMNVGNACYRMMDEQIDTRYRASPEQIIEKLRQDSAALMNTPLQFYGVEMPEKAKISILGTDIKIGLMTFTQILQIVLAPILLLWLGSLYNTRYRETLLIGSAKELSDIYPHSINIYPCGHFLELRKPTKWKHHIPKFFAFSYFCVRSVLLTVFIAPPIVAYLLSLYFLNSDQNAGVFIVLGFLIGTFGLTNIFAELFPWHYRKVFPNLHQRNAR